MTNMRQTAIFVAVAILYGCGGGSSSTVSPPPAPTPSPISYPIEASIVGVFTGSSNFSTSATDTGGNSYTLSFSISPGVDGHDPTDATKVLKSAIETVLLKKNGVTVSTSATNIYYTLAPLLVYGAHDGQNNSVVTAQKTPLPTTSTVGTQGPIYSGSQYINGSTLPLDTHAQTATWSLEADTASTAWLCINIQTQTILGGSNIESDCYKINSAGSVSGFKADITSQGVTLKFR